MCRFVHQCLVPDCGDCRHNQATDRAVSQNVADEGLMRERLFWPIDQRRRVIQVIYDEKQGLNAFLFVTTTGDSL